MKRRTKSIVRIAISGALIGSPPALAQTCSDNNGQSPWACVDWSQPGNPTEDAHFRFDFETDPNKPGVTFLVGDSGWVVWSQVSSSNTNPAALGDVTIDPEPSTSHIYKVKIINGGTSGAGATTLGDINLTSSASGWSGYAILTGGSITGNMTGDIKTSTPTSDPPSGGATFTIGGNLTGDVNVYKIAAGGITITGDMAGDITIHTIADGDLTIEGDFGAAGGDTETISIVNIEDSDLTIEGDAPQATINVTGTLEGGTLQIGEAASLTTITLAKMEGASSSVGSAVRTIRLSK